MRTPLVLRGVSWCLQAFEAAKGDHLSPTLLVGTVAATPEVSRDRSLGRSVAGLGVGGGVCLSGG